MRCDIVTIFPEVCGPYLDASIIKRAQAKGLLEIKVHNLRDYCLDKHHQVDDVSYGGGPGMVFKPEPIFKAVEEITQGRPRGRVILTSPAGRLFNQALARELSLEQSLLIICGHYEGIDERVARHLATDEISIGDYILTGGELPALVIADAVTRLIPGALGDEQSAERESFTEGRLDYPHYTRPAEYRGLSVPPVLLSGNHKEIDRWRRIQALKRTWERRPDILNAVELSEADRNILEQIREDKI